ncbi:hypothetical protein PFISCL1PPCAC_444, partial [Pristionchus fissidentatus]
ISPYGVLVRVCQFIICPLLIAFAVGTEHFELFTDVWHRKQDTLSKVPAVPNTLASFAFLPWPLVIVGAIAAIVKNMKNRG